MRRAGKIFLSAGLALGGCWIASCGGSNETDFQRGTGGTADAGTGGSGGPDASAGTGGAADGGAAGTAGSGGVGGNPDGGAAGTAGSGGTGGNPDGGAAGTAGSGGVGGNPDGGAAGTAGSGGTGNTGGSSGSGGHADGGTTNCMVTSDCPDGQFCSKNSCATLVGTCEDRPTTCDNTESPVCGCDGITYWNDCIRRQHGEEASFNGKCDDATAMHCGGIANLQCAEPWATCAFVFQNKNMCSMMDPRGNCWALPDTCPQVVIGGNLRACGPGPSTACSGTCKAIMAGGTWYQDNTCPQ